MLYSEAIKKASKIAFEAHKEDLDKGDYPYIMHPLYLAFQMTSENAVCAALLHDVIEDHGDLYPFEKLKELGIPQTVLGALKLLTHEDGVPYLDYVAKIKENPIAREVKIADLRHNLDSSRTGGKLPKKVDLYRQALEFLTND